MAGDGSVPRSVFAIRLDALLRTHKQPGTNLAWTDRALAAAMTELGHKISHPTISRLRSGRRMPRVADIDALSEVTGVPPSYFHATDVDEREPGSGHRQAPTQTPPEDVDQSASGRGGRGSPGLGAEEWQLLDAMKAHPNVRAIAMRLAEQGPMPDETARAIMSIIEQVQRIARPDGQGVAATPETGEPSAGT